MPRSYKQSLRAKGIKPIRRRAHTPKAPGDYELLPVRGVHIHQVPRPLPKKPRKARRRGNVVDLTPRLVAKMGEMA